jgi:YesN/AraC family two-component response regulator
MLEAQDGSEAHEIAKNYVGPIEVLVADVIMPHLRGIDLAGLLTATFFSGADSGFSAGKASCAAQHGNKYC